MRYECIDSVGDVPFYFKTSDQKSLRQNFGSLPLSLSASTDLQLNFRFDNRDALERVRSWSSMVRSLSLSVCLLSGYFSLSFCVLVFTLSMCVVLGTYLSTCVFVSNLSQLFTLL